MTSLLVLAIIDPVVGSILNAGVRSGVLAVTAAAATGQYDDKCSKQNERYNRFEFTVSHNNLPDS